MNNRHRQQLPIQKIHLIKVFFKALGSLLAEQIQNNKIIKIINNYYDIIVIIILDMMELFLEINLILSNKRYNLN